MTQATRSALMSVATTLAANIDATQDYIPVASTANFSTSVVAEIESTNEVVSFTDISSNMTYYSQELDQQPTAAGWFGGRLDLTDDSTTAPDGTTTAWKAAQVSGSTIAGYIKQYPTVVNATTYTMSFFGKAGTDRNFLIFREAVSDASLNMTSFNLGAGTIGTTAAGHTANISAEADGWYRCSITFTTNANRAGDIVFYVSNTDSSVSVADNQGFIYLWGAQLEIAATATTYLPTTTTAPLYGLTDVTRGANGTTAASASSGDDIQQLPYALLNVDMPVRLQGLSVSSDGTGAGRLTLCDKIGTHLCDVDIPDTKIFDLDFGGGILFPNGIYIANSDNITAYTLYTSSYNSPNLTAGG